MLIRLDADIVPLQNDRKCAFLKRKQKFEIFSSWLLKHNKNWDFEWQFQRALPYRTCRILASGHLFAANHFVVIFTCRCSKSSFLVRIELGANMTIAVAELWSHSDEETADLSPETLNFGAFDCQLSDYFCDRDAVYRLVLLVCKKNIFVVITVLLKQNPFCLNCVTRIFLNYFGDFLWYCLILFPQGK